MRRMLLILMIALLPLTRAAATYVHVDYDYKGATQAEAAYLALAKAEGLNVESIEDMLDHYTSAEVASAGIWLAKFLERKSMKYEDGLLASGENKYYKVILFMVEKRITPRLIRIGRELLHYPDQFLYWGPYLFKVTEDVMNLCGQFSSVVTNGRLSFDGVKFLSLNSDLKQYFDLSKLGEVNWDEMWDNITNIDTPSWEDFREDFKQLFDRVSPVNIAVAGGENIQGRASHIFDRFEESPNSIPDMFNKVEEAFREVTSGAAVKSILEGVLGDLKDSLAVERLFNLNDYNVGQYANEYVNKLMGRFYTQLWYIYHEGNVTGSNSYYTQVYYIVYYTYSGGHSERHVVYGAQYDSRTDRSAFEAELRDRRQALYMTNPQNYQIESDTQVWHYEQGTTQQIIDYEALFDSRVNHERVFEMEFERRRKTLEDTIEYVNPLQPRVRYYIGKGEKYYYEVESAETVRNTGTASFSVTCHDEVELSKGGFNFKVNERYNSSKMNQYAYPPDMVPDKQEEDTTPLENKMEGFQSDIDANNETIAGYEDEIAALQAVADTTTNASRKASLNSQITTLRFKVNTLKSKNEALLDSINTYQNILDEYAIDYNEDLDGPYRIPTLENDLAHDFRLSWDGPGSWSGHTYTRYAHIVGMENGVKLVCEVSQQRREMRFLGIRYHRAIIGVEYRLVSEYETSDIVDIIQLSDDQSDQEKADLINQRRSEIQQEYPSCHVQVVKSEKDPPEKDTDGEPFHLLWPSDRLALARFVEYRLRQIDGQLSFIERTLYSRRNVLEDFKKAFLTGVPRWRTSNGYGAALQRWLDVGTGVYGNSVPNP